MKNQGTAGNTVGKITRARHLAISAAAIGLLLVTALPLSAQEKKASGAMSSDSIGFIASKNPGANEIGLPLYPGARPHQDKSDDTPKFQLGLWGGAWGFKLVVLKLETNDSPAKVTAFYHKALSKYGRVLDCSEGAKTTDARDLPVAADGLDCKDSQADAGESLLKAGTKEKQHIFTISRLAGLSIFQLVYVEMPLDDEKK